MHLRILTSTPSGSSYGKCSQGEWGNQIEVREGKGREGKGENGIEGRGSGSSWRKEKMKEEEANREDEKRNKIRLERTKLVTSNFWDFSWKWKWKIDVWTHFIIEEEMINRILVRLKRRNIVRENERKWCRQTLSINYFFAWQSFVFFLSYFAIQNQKLCFMILWYLLIHTDMKCTRVSQQLRLLQKLPMKVCIIYWLIVSLTDLLNHWLTDWMNEWRAYLLTCLLTCLLTYSLTDYLTDWLFDWLTDYLTDWLTD